MNFLSNVASNAAIVSTGEVKISRYVPDTGVVWATELSLDPSHSAKINVDGISFVVTGINHYLSDDATKINTRSMLENEVPLCDIYVELHDGLHHHFEHTALDSCMSPIKVRASQEIGDTQDLGEVYANIQANIAAKAIFL